MSHHSPTLHKIFLSIAVLCLVGYAFFNSRFLLQGPEIVLANVGPDSNVIHTTTKDFSLQGKVTHSSFITVNNRPIMVDEAGNFNEKLLLSNGVSIIDIYARDKFGKETREKIDVVYASEEPSSVVAYEQIALRAQESSETASTTPVDMPKTEDAQPAVNIAGTVSASSSIMTIMPVPNVSNATSSEI